MRSSTCIRARLFHPTLLSAQLPLRHSFPKRWRRLPFLLHRCPKLLHRRKLRFHITHRHRHQWLNSLCTFSVQTQPGVKSFLKMRSFPLRLRRRSYPKKLKPQLRPLLPLSILRFHLQPPLHPRSLPKTLTFRAHFRPWRTLMSLNFNTSIQLRSFLPPMFSVLYHLHLPTRSRLFSKRSSSRLRLCTFSVRILPGVRSFLMSLICCRRLRLLRRLHLCRRSKFHAQLHRWRRNWISSRCSMNTRVRSFLPIFKARCHLRLTPRSKLSSKRLSCRLRLCTFSVRIPPGARLNLHAHRHR